jgi:hypothetical protein
MFMKAAQPQSEEKNTETQYQIPPSKKNILFPLAILLLFSVLALLVYTLTEKQKSNPAGSISKEQYNASNQNTINNSESAKDDSEKNDNTASIDNTAIIEAEDFNTYEDFIKKYDSLPDSTLEAIKKAFSYDASSDAEGNHALYITILPDWNSHDILYANGSTDPGKLYTLNLKTGNLELLRDLSSDEYDVNLVGRQGDKILFYKEDKMDSPGPCYNPWTYAYNHPAPEPGYPKDIRAFFLLDINDPDSKLVRFQIPKEKYEAELKNEKECTEDFDRQLKKEEENSKKLEGANSANSQ